MVYIMNSRTARATENDPVLETNKTKQKNFFTIVFSYMHGAVSSCKYMHVNSGAHDKLVMCGGAGGMISEVDLWPPHACMHVSHIHMYTHEHTCKRH